MLVFPRLGGPLIVSCQADEGTPLRDTRIMAAMAEAAVLGGAAAIRANGPADIEAIRTRVEVPIIGLQKRVDERGIRWITPSFDDARRLVDAGADVVALDATLRPRSGEAPHRLLERIRTELRKPVLADVDRLDAGVQAAAAGADAIATTLSGYTEASPSDDGPDLALVQALAAALGVPVVAEGRFRTPDEMRSALEAGAVAVAIGGAITDPIALTRRFATALAHGGDAPPPSSEAEAT
jgi:N-acylglucosamine-6-phosphate 2-epimerase